MNKYFDYDNIGLWDQKTWESKISPTNILAKWLFESGCLWTPPASRAEDRDLPADAVYKDRTRCYIFPDTIRKWTEKGLIFECGRAGEYWITMIPKSVQTGQNHDPKTLSILCHVDILDVFWSMDILARYENYLELAAHKEYMLVFFATNKPSRADMFGVALREVSHRNNVNLGDFYLDMSGMYGSGHRLSEVPDLNFVSKDKKPLENQDDLIETFDDLDIPVINITGQWASKYSEVLLHFLPGHIPDIPLDFERVVHSSIGKCMAEAMKLEYDYDTCKDPGFDQQMKGMGIKSDYFETDNRGWATITPLSAYESDKKVPCMIILQEISKADPRSVISAYSLWYEYLKIAAQGDLMLIFFALEDVVSNEMIHDLLAEATAKYPFLDRSRVYITGHSHNGHYAMDFMRRFPKSIAGVATMGNPHGIGAAIHTVVITDEMVSLMQSLEIPTINIDGQWENGYASDLPKSYYKYLTDEEKVEYWQKRLKANNCPMKSAAEILAATKSGSLATRMVGVPNDRSEVVYFQGDECYLADVKNSDGNVRLRVVTLENMPHALTAHMPWLSWSFLRRFARDQETGEIIELF